MNGTWNHGILYSPTKKYDLIGYTDSDWAGDVETRKSTSGYVFYFRNKIISWSSKKQLIVALSTIEAKYIAATHASCHAI